MSAPFGPRAGSDLRSTGRATSANIRAMFDRVTRLAAQVISQADRAHPADAVLREVLRAEHGLAREDGRKVRDAVFAHYRWLGWLTEEPLLDQIRRAVELDNRFQRAPGSFSDDDLVVGRVTRELT
ncbi:MAG TPA: hypothetical protein VNO52_13500, partial [Methylomirabilota bacterium]|nr:hypothetical protein [Methylomirabilota bacterium]